MSIIAHGNALHCIDAPWRRSVKTNNSPICLDGLKIILNGIGTGNPPIKGGRAVERQIELRRSR